MDSEARGAVIVEKQKLGVKGFFSLLLGGALAGCLAQIVSVILLGIIVVVSLSTFGANKPESRADVLRKGSQDKVAVIDIIGEITSRQNTYDGSAGAEKILAQLDQAQSDSAVKAVVIDMDTPGGEVTPSFEIYEKVKALSAAKPVVVFIRSIGASGGYYVASGAGKIVAAETAWTGSIGVILEYPVITKLLDKVGIEIKVFKSAPHKDLGSPYRQPDGAEAAILQGLVDDAYGQFISAVVSGRDATEEAVRAAADGRIYTASQALSVAVTKADGSIEKVKLIDEVGNFDQAIAATGIKDPTVIRYRGPGFLSGSLSSITRLLASLTPDKPATRMLYIWRPE